MLQDVAMRAIFFISRMAGLRFEQHEVLGERFVVIRAGSAPVRSAVGMRRQPA